MLASAQTGNPLRDKCILYHDHLFSPGLTLAEQCLNRQIIQMKLKNK